MGIGIIDEFSSLAVLTVRRWHFPRYLYSIVFFQIIVASGPPEIAHVGDLTTSYTRPLIGASRHAMNSGNNCIMLFQNCPFHSHHKCGSPNTRVGVTTWGLSVVSDMR